MTTAEKRLSRRALARFETLFSAGRSEGLGIALNAANVFTWQAAGPYVVALVLGLATASGMFLLLLARFFPHDGDN